MTGRILSWFNTLKWLGLAVMVAGSVKAGFYLADSQCELVRARTLAKASEAASQRQSRLDRADKAATKARTEQQETVRTIEKEVIRYVQRPLDTECLDDNWLQLHNAAATAGVVHSGAAGLDDGKTQKTP